MAMSTGKVVALIQAMGGADPAVIEAKVEEWLDAHPEATTTVQDGSITEQKLATSIAQKLGLISSLSDEIEDKYDRYKQNEITGLSLDMFDICPSQYTIYTYEDSDTLKHSAFSGITWLMSRMKREITECVFKLLKTAEIFGITVATNATIGKAIRYNYNTTGNNVTVYTSDAGTGLPGIARNPNCAIVVAGDYIKFVRNGTKVAFYHLENNLWIPIADTEFFDVSQWFETTGLSADDVSLGFITNNSARNDPLINNFTNIFTSGDHFMAYDEVDSRLSALENGAGFNPSIVDLFMFMGQSNMAGRGNGASAPEVISGAGYEFKAITDPTKLYPITEPFGVDENVENKIYDYLGGNKAKSGDMIPAFVNAYFTQTHVSIVGVSASEGGTRISLWQPDTARYTDALARYASAKNWLESNGYTIRHKYMLWCQGESNGDDGMPKADYISAFTTMANAWFANGIEKIFVVKIGNYNGTGTADYTSVMDAQNEICQTMQNVIMASTDFAGMKARGLMKDEFHYTQTAYNEVGTYAGENVAFYVKTGKEPTMYDTQKANLYYTHKN